MTFIDLIELSAGNLWRIKLRAFLTIMGVVIAIATFTAMLSFGAGNQKYVTDMYNDLGLFTTIKVFPKQQDADSGDVKTPVLDKEAIEKLSCLPGVKLAYPFVAYDVTVQVGDTQFSSRARSLSGDAMHTTMMFALMSGITFSSDSAREAIVSHAFLEKLGLSNPDSLKGKVLIVSVGAASLDSALINVIDDNHTAIWQRLREIHIDSLFHEDYRRRIMRQELSEGLRRFIDGFMTRQLIVSDTLTIIGVTKPLTEHNREVPPIVITDRTARRLGSAGFIMSVDPTSLLTAARDGTLFFPEKITELGSYPKVTLEIEDYAPHGPIVDSVDALGYRAISYAQQFDKIQRFFLYYNLALAVLGAIALVTASLGIINTMIMSIIERRREIGVIKSLGADEREIWMIFLVESGVIGAIGSIVGIICGWTATRIISAIIKAVMENEGMPQFDLFALPLWLIALAFAFGVIISLLAGFYPAVRASRVDPVEALRGE